MRPFRLSAGDVGPVQQTRRTCGSAVLTTARMLADPGFAQWMATGDKGGDDTLPDGADQQARFAAYEALVHRRTNGFRGPGGRLQVPWPRALGTPPWGARAELEHGAARAGVRFGTKWSRWPGRRARELYTELAARVGDGSPAALYIGSPWLPRHVTLLLPGDEGLLVYDPSDGRVQALSAQRLSDRSLGIAGWDTPWCAVLPRPD